MEHKEYQDEIEIDLLQLFYALMNKIWLIIGVTLVAGCGAALFTHFFITPTYKSTSGMLVISKETTLTSLADLQLGSQLTNDYKVLITSRPVLEKVIENLEMDMTYQRLKSAIEIQNPSNTRIINITVTMSEPELAKAVVNELTKVAADFIGDQMEVAPPNIFEEGELPSAKSSPNVMKNTLLGMILGVFLICAVIVVIELLNDSVQTEEDIERYLGIPTLAEVPAREIDSKKSKRGRVHKKIV